MFVPYLTQFEFEVNPTEMQGSIAYKSNLCAPFSYENTAIIKLCRKTSSNRNGFREKLQESIKRYRKEVQRVVPVQNPTE